MRKISKLVIKKGILESKMKSQELTNSFPTNYSNKKELVSFIEQLKK
jgi:hypothetical protein